MHPYTQRILGLLGDRPPLEALERTPAKMEDLHGALAPDGLDRSWAPGKWTGREIFGHLADVEVGVGYRVRQAITHDDYRIEPFDQDAWARSYRQRDAAAAVEAFRALRAWNLSLFRLLKPEELARVTHHPERGDESVETIVKMLAGHDLNHLGQLERIRRP
jgi:hypothetical protein